MAVATIARIRKVFDIVCPSVELGDDMLDIERPRTTFLIASAVFAISICPAAHQTSSRCGQIRFTHCLPSLKYQVA